MTASESRLVPIETAYQGCHFRSRLEARWAVFFDTLDIPWEYEPQGYVVDGRPYLPDFRISESYLVEVKGSVDRLDVPFLCRVAEHIGDVIILGPIPIPPPVGVNSLGKRVVDFDYAWPMVTCCPGVEGEDHRICDVSFSWWPHRRHIYTCSGLGHPLPTDRDYPWLTPIEDMMTLGAEVADAYRAARSARFEHGETPVIR